MVLQYHFNVHFSYYKLGGLSFVCLIIIYISFSVNYVFLLLVFFLFFLGY